MFLDHDLCSTVNMATHFVKYNSVSKRKKILVMNYLVTYKDAMEMVEVYKNFNFSKSEYMLSDYKVVSFGYFLCDYNNFMRPLKDKPEVNALDMRGVT